MKAAKTSLLILLMLLCTGCTCVHRVLKWRETTSRGTAVRREKKLLRLMVPTAYGKNAAKCICGRKSKCRCTDSLLASISEKPPFTILSW